MTDPKEVKACKDCRFFQEDVGDPTGKTHGCKKVGVYTEDARFSSRCGPDAKLFEKKEDGK